MPEPYLSVLIPAYNEDQTLERVIDAVLKVDEDLEIVLIDDGSHDGTWAVMQSRVDGDRVRAVRHEVNGGKGAAIRTGLTHARGHIVIIQDADLEYSPTDYPALLEPIKTGRATVVYGSRLFASHAAYSYWYVVGNRMVTLFTNVLYNCFLSDIETGYKVMPVEIARSLDLKARGFELEPEITAKLLRLGQRIFEVPITYTARSHEEGKKLTAMDGVRAIITLMRFRSWKPRPQSRG